MDFLALRLGSAVKPIDSFLPMALCSRGAIRPNAERLVLGAGPHFDDKALLRLNTLAFA